MTADQERRWWDHLGGVEIGDNTGVVPPYDVDKVADKIIAALNTRRLLDLGCGAGRLTNVIARKLPPSSVVFGVDISRPLLNEAVIHAPSNVLYWRGDGRHLPTMTSNKMTGAYSVTLFQHIPFGAMIGYCADVLGSLCNGGTFLFTVAVGDDPPGFLNHQLSLDGLDNFCEWMMTMCESVSVEPDDEIGWTWIRAVKP